MRRMRTGGSRWSSVQRCAASCIAAAECRQMFKVNTSILEDIAEATQLFCGYLQHMPRGLAPMLSEVEAACGCSARVNLGS